MSVSNKKEFKSIVGDYIYHPRISEMKNFAHHGINRFDHSYRVAYHTYKITKFLKLNYKSATKAAILHDFFLDEVQDEKSISRLRKHPDVAAYNANKYFGINSFEEDIIKNHMFPITSKAPNSFEGWIVDLVDDYVSIYERFMSLSGSLKFGVNLNIILLITFIKSFY